MAALESYRAELIKKSVAVFLADSCTGLTWLVLPLDNKAFTAPADLRYSPLLSGRGFFILYGTLLYGTLLYGALRALTLNLPPPSAQFWLEWS